MANNLYNQLNQNQPYQNRQLTVQDIMAEVRQSGMSAKDLFLKKAQEKGIDPQSILSQIPNNFR